jgi:hypothetical protein
MVVRPRRTCAIPRITPFAGSGKNQTVMIYVAPAPVASMQALTSAWETIHHEHENSASQRSARKA